jgi:hypothetical protein
MPCNPVTLCRNLRKRVFVTKRGLPLVLGLIICAVRAVTYERDLDLKIHKSFLYRQWFELINCLLE